MNRAQLFQQTDKRPNTASENNLPKWFNSLVTFHRGTLESVRPFVPDFERRAFDLKQPDNEHSRLNERLNTIVRKPFREDRNFIPVGVVSKRYALVQHLDVLDVAVKAFDEVKIAPKDVGAELKITEYGERMELSPYLPNKFSFDPGDKNPLALRLECFNSVDGSTRFRALMGWFRFVCSNSLVIGVTQSDVRRRHVGELGLADVGSVLKSGIQASEKERENLKNWRQKGIVPGDLSPWVEKELRKNWGYKAAARFYHISRTGHDAEIIGPYKKTPQSQYLCVKPTACQEPRKNQEVFMT